MHNQYLETLQLQPGATKTEIKSAYRRLSKVYHPDISKSPNAKDKFIEINEAYKFLHDVGPFPYTNPTPTYKTQSYDYDPFDYAYEEKRRQAKAYAFKRAKEAARRQADSIKYLLGGFDMIAYFIIGFNLLLCIDVILPISQSDQNIIEATRVGQRTNSQKGIRIFTYDVHFDDLLLRFDKEHPQNIDFHQTVTLFTTPILNVPLFADFAEMASDRKIRVHQAYSVYKFFSFLILILLVIFLIYKFVDQSLDSQLTWAIVMLFIAAFQLFLFHKF